jgi:uncharacterized membrane protein
MLGGIRKMNIITNIMVIILIIVSVINLILILKQGKSIKTIEEDVETLNELRNI